jgi:class 3 adenylate cyclase
MALLGGFSDKSSAALLQEELSIPKRKSLRLDTFPKGMDNSRIDVRLESTLKSAIESEVGASLAKYMRQLQIPVSTEFLGEEGFSPDALKKGFNEMSVIVAQKARTSSRREIYQLFILSVIKQVYLSVDRQIKECREGFDMDSTVGEISSGNTVSMHEKLWRFSRHQAKLRYLVSRELIERLHSFELTGRKHRKSILALSWPVAEEMLFNPVGQLSDLSDESGFIEIYPFMLIKSEIFGKFEKQLLDVLCRRLPDCPVRRFQGEQDGELSNLQLRRDQGDFPAYAQVEAYLRAVMFQPEYQRAESSWFDDPANLSWLLGGDGDRDRPSFWDEKRWLSFQNGLLQDLEKAFSKSGLLEMVFASALAPDLYRALGRKGSLRLLYEYLLGGRSKKELASILQQFKDITNLDFYVERMERTRKQIKQASTSQRRSWLIQVVDGYANLRRDLKLAWETYRAMDMIRLLEKNSELSLSRANALLQEFVLREDGQAPEVQGHVILKADLRGSTELTAGMIREGLNPAAHFSQNLFDPINTLLQKYSAEKVFIEGDAVILMLLDYSSPPSQVVARACRLAYDIISLILERNRDSRHMGLPELELGVGISYVSEAPCYLFDAGRKITISPAINKADRLSSCTKRDFAGFGKNRGWGVEVIEIEQTANGVSGEAQCCRYNVNGIELDMLAFQHLSEEVVLKKVKASSYGKDTDDHYYVGRFPDASGKTRWQVVRHSLVKHWDGEKFLNSPDEGGNSFYELVTDPDILGRTREKLSGRN